MFPTIDEWPVCGKCVRPYVLRRCITTNGHWAWLWVRDCKHKRVVPVMHDWYGPLTRVVHGF